MDDRRIISISLWNFSSEEDRTPSCDISRRIKRSLTIDAGSRPRRVGARGPCRSTCVSRLGLRSPIPPIPQHSRGSPSSFCRTNQLASFLPPTRKAHIIFVVGFVAGRRALSVLLPAYDSPNRSKWSVHSDNRQKHHYRVCANDCLFHYYYQNNFNSHTLF